MKYFFFILLLLSMLVKGNTQTRSYPFYQLYQLDSIGHSSSIGRHFGDLYYRFLQLVEKELEKEDTATQRLVRHFEMVFAQFYIDACVAYRNHTEILLPAWRAYFADSTLERVRYNLLGTNAHLNGGLAEAIAGSYTQKEWNSLKKKYGLFNKCLNKIFNQVYEETIATNKRARILGLVFLGSDRVLGKYYLYKWRKRQMRLTEYYFEGSAKYKPLSEKINSEKERIDKLVFIKL